MFIIHIIACFQCNILWQLLHLTIGILHTLSVKHTFKFIDILYIIGITFIKTYRDNSILFCVIYEKLFYIFLTIF